MSYERSEFDAYEEAFAHAINRANEHRQAYGIEKPTGLLKWSIKMIPNDPARRFGWEGRCQAVEPGTPLSTKQRELLEGAGITIAPLARG